MSLEFELAAVAKLWEGRKATYFPDPGGHNIPVISGVLADRAWMAEALGVHERDLLHRFRDASENPLAPEEVDGAHAPCQQIVHDDDFDVGNMLPLPTHHELDAGPYITAGLVIARNPETGRQNVSINRLQIQGRNRFGILILPRDLDSFFSSAEGKGEALPVSIAIGVDPLTLLSSQAVVPIDHDELEIAGALHGSGLRVVRSRTSDVLVPADTEIVVEGRLLPDVREAEGPFGEFPKYYGPAGDRQVVEVTCVTHRRQPLFHTIVPGGLEHLLLGSVPREATILSYLHRNFPGVRDLRLTLGGVGRYHLVAQFEKRRAGEVANLIMGAFSAHYDIKQVTVVDPDVDIHDRRAVEWAVATRFQADRDLIVLGAAQGSKLDPSSDDGVSAKMGLDATIPLDAGERYTVMKIPGEEHINLDKVTVGNVDPEILAEGAD